MSDNSHIDKILKDGLGEMNFSNADAMWQKMEAELDNDKKKRRPFVFFFALVGLLIAALFTVNHFNKTAVPVAEAKNIFPDAASDEKRRGEIVLADKDAPVLNNGTTATNNSDETSTIAKQTKKRLNVTNTIVETAAIDNFKAISDLNAVTESELNNPAVTAQEFTNDHTSSERIIVDADLITAAQFKQTAARLIPSVAEKVTALQLDKPKTGITKQHKITIEAIGGRDFLRMNRKAGFYAGIRVNKLLEKGTVISAGVNYTSHTVLDRYRLLAKPVTDPAAWTARINSMNSIRVPLYLQRQMGKSKLAMMIGLVPTYIIHAEVYNVPESFTGNPGAYRQFTLNDINRFNVLFGAGLKYSPARWMALELSGSYGLTGMVKNAYKNQSRVNDNFKSIQLGVAFRLK